MALVIFGEMLISATMADRIPDLQVLLEDTAKFINSLNRRSVPLLMDRVEAGLAFTDPAHDVRGADLALKILERRFVLLPSMSYKVGDIMTGRRELTGCLYWGLRYDDSPGFMGKVKKKAPARITIEGVTELSFLPSGTILSWREFWLSDPPFRGKKDYLSVTG